LTQPICFTRGPCMGSLHRSRSDQVQKDRHPSCARMAEHTSLTPALVRTFACANWRRTLPILSRRTQHCEASAGRSPPPALALQTSTASITPHR
ncbi:hypothetical protein PoB_000162800, partial [Plakobranchus ocellatus]